MGNILVVIPCLFHEYRTRETINSVVHVPNTTVLLIDNGAERCVKDVIELYRNFPNVIIESFEDNIYVNPAWNFGLKYFNDNDKYSNIIILNSDLVLCADWRKVVDSFIGKYPDSTILPTITQQRELMKPTDNEYPELELTEIGGGIPGVFILLSRKIASMVYPIPNEIIVWFGDNWIYDLLMASGEKMFACGNLFAYHYWSTSVVRVEGIHEMIEQDKIHWKGVVKDKLKELKNNL